MAIDSKKQESTKEKPQEDTPEGGAPKTLTQEDVSELVLKVIAEKREEIREEEKSKLLSDPNVAAAASVLEDIKKALGVVSLPDDAKTVVKERDAEIEQLKRAVGERDMQIADLEESVAQLSDVAREAGYKFFVERAVSGHPMADTIRTMVGNVRGYDSPQAIHERIEEVLSELTEEAERQEAANAQRERERRTLSEDVSKKDDRIAQLEEALEKSIELNKVMSVQRYADQRMQRHPKADDIRAIVESRGPRTTQEVDKIFEEFQRPQLDTEDLAAVRSRVRRITAGGTGSSPLEEETASPSGQRAPTAQNYNGLGVPLSDLRAWSGLDN